MKAPKNIFTFLLILAGTVLLWTGGLFFSELHGYFGLSHTACAEIEKWEVKEVKKDQYSLLATYHFKVKENCYKKNAQLHLPLYSNKLVADDHLKLWEALEWEVWYNAKDPTIASLQKNFPFKPFFHFILSLGVTLYFLWFSLSFSLTRVEG